MNVLHYNMYYMLKHVERITFAFLLYNDKHVKHTCKRNIHIQEYGYRNVRHVVLHVIVSRYIIV